jgi:hypothetical protein
VSIIDRVIEGIIVATMLVIMATVALSICSVLVLPIIVVACLAC